MQRGGRIESSRIDLSQSEVLTTCETMLWQISNVKLLIIFGTYCVLCNNINTYYDEIGCAI